MRSRFPVLLLCLGLLLMPMSAAAAPGELTHACPKVGDSSSFADVADTSPHAHAVACLVEWGITSGYPDGTYRPQVEVTRGQMASFLLRFIEAAQTEVPAPPPGPFTDVDPGSVHASAIDTLDDLGIVSGLTADC